MSDPGAGPSHTNPTSGCNGAPGSSDAGSSELPSQPARTPASNGNRATARRTLTPNNRKYLTMKKKLVSQQAKYKRALHEMRRVLASAKINRKLSEVEKRGSMLVDNMKELNTLVLRVAGMPESVIGTVETASQNIEDIVKTVLAAVNAAGLDL